MKASGSGSSPRCPSRRYIRLDSDIIDWLKSKGKGYQTRMNAMLRELMRSEKEQRGRRRQP